MNTKINNSELNFEKLYVTLGRYKWFILTIMLLSTLLMFLTLYFQPSVYLSSSIMEIKSKSKPKIPNDILLGALSFGGTGKVEKEIEILQTFSITNNALEKINFSVKYFKKENYKNIEMYKTSPIELTKISIFNNKLIGKKITLHPHKNHFTLSVNNSIKDWILSLFSIPSYIEFDSSKKHNYDKVIQNDFAQFTIKKTENFNEPITFILSGTKRDIYNDIIQESLSVQQLNPNAPLIEVSFEDNIPQRADDYVNALSQSFIEMSINFKNEQNSKVLSFINEQLEKIKITLQASERQLEKYKSKNKIIEPSTQAKKYIQKLSELEIKFSENVLKQKLIGNLLSFAIKNNNLDAIAPSLMELNDRPTLQLITILQELQLKESDLQTELTNEHPELITVREQIYNIRNKIFYNLKNLKALVLQKSRSIKSEKISYEAKIKTLPKEQKQLININRNYEVSSNMYNYLLKKKTESELLIVSTLSDYKIIDKAYSNTKPIKPKKMLLMIVAPLIGFLFATIIATILQGLNKKIFSYETLQSLSKFEIFGIIPEVSTKRAPLSIYENPQSRFTEAYRSLRANLPNKEAHEEAKIILLTSTIANEGKTTITSNLASIFQMAGHKTIILSLDLRNPNLHHHFELHNDKGMSTYLMGKDSIQDIIFATKHTNLHVISSGPIPKNPSELILSNRLTELLEILKTRYDYIFIDSAPIGLVSDTVPLMKIADQNLLVIRENHSKVSFLASLDNIIKKNKIQNVALVLNRSKSKNNSYGYGYGYGYGVN
ncbi:MAG: Tyrosine-protein kinase Wzc (EC [uncultured Sulfurovum sp.]|uniref:non-specific protein-tyrosine kinase n=1 Tax=uncultured Sulfurovum sp. TaxID=269237 RepID=A0A6S6SC16_9BACT|nr:MAG: Tyrosine-protein kinase Wzc (EC [uncultured Sulfurovum sp.]